MPYSKDRSFAALPDTLSDAAPLLGAAALIAGAAFIRSTPLRMVLALAGGALVGREVAAMLSDGAGASDDHPEYLSDYEPGPDGRLHPDDLVAKASEDSFPASDAPAYTASRAGKPAHG